MRSLLSASSRRLSAAMLLRMNHYSLSRGKALRASGTNPRGAASTCSMGRRGTTPRCGPIRFLPSRCRNEFSLHSKSRRCSIFARAGCLPRTACAASIRAIRISKANTEARPLSATLRIIKAQSGDGCWGGSCWHIFASMGRQQKRSPDLRTNVAPLARQRPGQCKRNFRRQSAFRAARLHRASLDGGRNPPRMVRLCAGLTGKAHIPIAASIAG